MSIPKKMRRFLDSKGIEYHVIPHRHTVSAAGSAREAHVPADQVAKSIVLEDEQGYLLAVIPASRRIALNEIRIDLDRDLEFAREDELAKLFPDCEIGAVPATGELYGVPTVIDTGLKNQPDVYFEAGDHEDLIHVSGREFERLFRHPDYHHLTY